MNKLLEYKIHPCRERIWEDGEKTIEICKPKDAEFWGVYEKWCDDPEWRNIADCPTEWKAHEIVRAMEQYEKTIVGMGGYR